MEETQHRDTEEHGGGVRRPSSRRGVLLSYRCSKRQHESVCSHTDGERPRRTRTPERRGATGTGRAQKSRAAARRTPHPPHLEVLVRRS